MKKYYLILFSISLTFWPSFSQQANCEINVKKAKAMLAENSPFNDEKSVFKLIEPCALTGNANAENLLGVFYLKGIGTNIDNVTAFSLFKSAAAKEHPKAQYNFGRMYKTGTGCSIDYKKAIHWFEVATQNGNQRAAYSLGYMYYKGLGVMQDYKQAIYWFEKSEDPMAKHFLGLCHYQGYGTPVNEEKALEILLTNDIVNSSTLVSYIKNNQREKTKEAVEEIIESNNAINSTSNNGTITDLEVAVTTPINELPNQELITPQDIQGEWVGKLVQYDWSGQKIERILPIELSFNGTNKTINIDYNFLGQQESIKAAFQDGYIYFKTPFNFTLNKLYSSNPKELTLNYELLSINLKKQLISDRPYLIGGTDTYIDNWKEYGQPTRIILKPKGASNNEDDEMLLALATQEDQFIKLYPVPFNNQLTVQYQLKTAGQVYIELVNIYGGDPIIISPKTMQKSGDYTYSINVDNDLNKGLYVVRLFAGDQLYTRLIVKEN